jgi:hypothetical protein
LVRQKNKLVRSSGVAGGTSPAAAVLAGGAGLDAPQAGRPSRTGLLVIVSVVVAWIAALAALALTTADETLLNRAQVRQADLVVTGRIVDLSLGTVAVERIWSPPGTPPPQPGDPPLVVRDLAESPARQGASYVLPLTRVGGNVLEITRPQLQDDRASRAEQQRPPRIYPANSHALEQLQRVLDE